MFKRFPDDNDYKVSDSGKVLSKKSGSWKELKGTVNRDGYITVEIANRRRIFIHQMVLITFVGYAPANKVCRHKNGNPGDNRLSNLRWGTHTKNNRDKIKHGTITRGEDVNTNKLTEKEVRRIRKLHPLYVRKRKYGATSKLARMYGVTSAAIHSIVKRKCWKWLL